MFVVSVALVHRRIVGRRRIAERIPLSADARVSTGTTPDAVELIGYSPPGQATTNRIEASMRINRPLSFQAKGNIWRGQLPTP